MEILVGKEIHDAEDVIKELLQRTWQGGGAIEELSEEISNLRETVAKILDTMLDVKLIKVSDIEKFVDIHSLEIKEVDSKWGTKTKHQT